MIHGRQEKKCLKDKMMKLIIVFFLVCRYLIVKVRYGIWDRFNFFRELKKRMIHGRQEKKCLKDKMLIY